MLHHTSVFDKNWKKMKLNKPRKQTLEQQMFLEAEAQKTLSSTPGYKVITPVALVSELRSCVKVEVAVQGSPSIISLVVSVDVKQH